MRLKILLLLFLIGMRAYPDTQPPPEAYIAAIELTIIGEGQNENTLQDFIQHPPFHEGERFSSESYENFKTQLISHASTLGYIKASFATHKVVINRSEHTATIYLTLDTGRRYYFGATHFNQNPLSDNFLNRFSPFRAGQPYDSNQVNQLQNNLTNSGYFRSAVIEPDMDESEATHDVPLNVKLKPKSRQQYILGAGYGTDTGPRATLGSDWRYVNSDGHRFNTLLRVSQVQKTASAKYIIPGKHPLTDEYNLNGSIQTNNYNQGNSQVRQVGAGYTLTRGNWQRTFNLNYQLDHYNLFDSPYRTSHLLLPGIGLQNVTTNDPIFPTEGHRYNFNVIAAKQGIMADTSLVQAKLAGKWLYSFNDKNMVILRSDFGYTAIHNINQFPLSLSFFAGGSQSVRGYAYNALGPGRYLIVGSAEYRYRIVEKWYLATFFDIGNAFNNWPEAPYSGLKSNLGAIYRSLDRGAGFGVVWNSPVGPMELTIAQAITSVGKPNRIQFNMGTDL